MITIKYLKEQMHEELMFLLGSIPLTIDFVVNLCKEGIGSL